MVAKTMLLLFLHPVRDNKRVVIRGDVLRRRRWEEMCRSIWRFATAVVAVGIVLYDQFNAAMKQREGAKPPSRRRVLRIGIG